MALKEMNYQEMKRQGGNLNAHYRVKVIKKSTAGTFLNWQ